MENDTWPRTRYGTTTYPNLSDCTAAVTTLNEGGGGGGGGGGGIIPIGTDPRPILARMNPLRGVCDGEITLGCIVSIIVNSIVFPIASILLFVMIVWGGYKMVAGSFACEANTIELGRRRIVGAILGYGLLGIVYWLWIVVESVLHLKIT